MSSNFQVFVSLSSHVIQFWLPLLALKRRAYEWTKSFSFVILEAESSNSACKWLVVRPLCLSTNEILWSFQATEQVILGQSMNDEGRSYYTVIKDIYLARTIIGGRPIGFNYLPLAYTLRSFCLWADDKRNGCRLPFKCWHASIFEILTKGILVLTDHCDWCK